MEVERAPDLAQIFEEERGRQVGEVDAEAETRFFNRVEDGLLGEAVRELLSRTRHLECEHFVYRYTGRRGSKLSCRTLVSKANSKVDAKAETQLFDEVKGSFLREVMRQLL